jgi:ABC-2 type transport system ATP-binding protein
MIQVFNLQKAYNGITVLNIPELTVPQGESFGLVGNNGAGKTTLFRLILDLLKPQTGMSKLKIKRLRVTTAGNPLSVRSSTKGF